MSHQVSKTLIGAFVAGSILLLIIAIIFFGSVKLFNSTATFVMFFDKSISGLSPGSPVVFMGVPVGRVIDIKVDKISNDIGFTIPVYVELYENTHTIFIKHNLPQEGEEETEYLNNLIKQGLRASLAQQSLLTGQLMIELNFITPESQMETTHVVFYKGTPVIPTVPSKLDNILKELTSLPLDKISGNILEITNSLKTLLNTPETPNIIPQLSNFLHQGLAAVTEFNQSLIDIRKASKKYGIMIEGLNTELSLTLKEAKNSFQTINNTTERLLGNNSPTLLDIHHMLQEISKAAKAVRILANMLERNPEVLIRGKGINQK